MKRMIIALCALGLASSAVAQNAVILNSQGETARLRVSGAELSNMTLADLNAYRAKKPSEYKGKICKVQDFLGRSDIATADRDTAAGYDDMFNTSNSETGIITKAGRWDVWAQSGLYQKCDGTWGSVVVVTGTDMKTMPITKKVLFYNEVDRLAPMYLYKPRKAEGDKYVLAFSSCMNCGEIIAIYYDAAKQTMFYKDEGDGL